MTTFQYSLHIPPDATLIPSKSIPKAYLLTQSQHNVQIDNKTLLETNINSFLIIGRQESIADIRISHASISRKHAALYYSLNSLVLKDLGGKYGCHVNGKRMNSQSTRELQHNDVIQFGNVTTQVFTVQWDIFITNKDTTTNNSNKNILPITCICVLPSKSHHVITSTSLDPSGSRLITTSTDTQLRFYDFNTITPLHKRPFKSVQILEGHPTICAKFSPTGDRIFVCTTSAEAMLLDREGRSKIQCTKGDPYVRDMARTFGHTSSVTSIAWHPFWKHMVLTGSLDGSIRTWDVEHGNTKFGKLCCTYVYQMKDISGKKVGVKCLTWSPDGREICVGTNCGSLQVWLYDKQTRPEKVNYLNTSPIHSMVYNRQGLLLASRSNQESHVKIWNIKFLTKASLPLLICSGSGIESVYDYSNCCFSPDGKYVCVGTCAEINKNTVFPKYETNYENIANYEDFIQSKKLEIEEYQEKNKDDVKNDPHQQGRLLFFRLPESILTKQIQKYSYLNTATIKLTPEFDKYVITGISVVTIEWHIKINQIVLGLSNGTIHVLYDPQLSAKGALLCTLNEDTVESDLDKLLKSREPIGSSLYYTGRVITPHSLPLFRETNQNTAKMNTKHKKDNDENNPSKKYCPESPSTGIKMGEGRSSSLNFTQYIVSTKNMAKNKNKLGKDPREELFQYTEGKTFLKNDIKVLAENTIEQEVDELNERRQNL